jgi:hypothetical protein
MPWGETKMVARSGCGGLLVIAAIFYFTDAGSWMLGKLNGLNDHCYATLSDISPDIANPVCRGVAAGFTAFNQAIYNVSDTVDAYKQKYLGGANVELLDELTASLTRNIGDLASSGDSLSRMMALGPNNPQAFSTSQPFQRAIDSFAIGQQFTNDPSRALEGLGWLKQGAQQPMGYGVMSQLALGNVYANGAPGIAANPAAANAYLQQASQSIAVLSSSNSPQARQILNSLPASPQAMQRDLARAMRQLNPSAAR